MRLPPVFRVFPIWPLALMDSSCPRSCTAQFRAGIPPREGKEVSHGWRVGVHEHGEWLGQGGLGGDRPARGGAGAGGPRPLREMSKRAKGLFAQQAALTGAKQEVTRELNELIKEGNAQVDFIKTGARVRYGKDSEKLI